MSRRLFYMEKVFVFGHKNPDTDSISAAISYTYLKTAIRDEC